MRKRRWLALAMAAVMTTSSVPAEFLTAYADEYDYEETQEDLIDVFDDSNAGDDLVPDSDFGLAEDDSFEDLPGEDGIVIEEDGIVMPDEGLTDDLFMDDEILDETVPFEDDWQEEFQEDLQEEALTESGEIWEEEISEGDPDFFEEIAQEEAPVSGSTEDIISITPHVSETLPVGFCVYEQYGTRNVCFDYGITADVVYPNITQTERFLNITYIYPQEHQEGLRVLYADAWNGGYLCAVFYRDGQLVDAPVENDFLTGNYQVMIMKDTEVNSLPLQPQDGAFSITYTMPAISGNIAVGGETKTGALYQGEEDWYDFVPDQTVTAVINPGDFSGSWLLYEKEVVNAEAGIVRLSLRESMNIPWQEQFYQDEQKSHEYLIGVVNNITGDDIERNYSLKVESMREFDSAQLTVDNPWNCIYNDVNWNEKFSASLQLNYKDGSYETIERWGRTSIWDNELSRYFEVLQGTGIYSKDSYQVRFYNTDGTLIDAPGSSYPDGNLIAKAFCNGTYLEGTQTTVDCTLAAAETCTAADDMVFSADLGPLETKLYKFGIETSGKYTLRHDSYSVYGAVSLLKKDPASGVYQFAPGYGRNSLNNSGFSWTYELAQGDEMVLVICSRDSAHWDLTMSRDRNIQSIQLDDLQVSVFEYNSLFYRLNGRSISSHILYEGETEAALQTYTPNGPYTDSYTGYSYFNLRDKTGKEIRLYCTDSAGNLIQPGYSSNDPCYVKAICSWSDEAGEQHEVVSNVAQVTAVPLTDFEISEEDPATLSLKMYQEKIGRILISESGRYRFTLDSPTSVNAYAYIYEVRGSNSYMSYARMVNANNPSFAWDSPSNPAEMYLKIQNYNNEETQYTVTLEYVPDLTPADVTEPIQLFDGYEGDHTFGEEREARFFSFTPTVTGRYVFRTSYDDPEEEYNAFLALYKQKTKGYESIAYSGDYDDDFQWHGTEQYDDPPRIIYNLEAGNSYLFRLKATGIGMHVSFAKADSATGYTLNVPDTIGLLSFPMDASAVQASVAYEKAGNVPLTDWDTDYGWETDPVTNGWRSYYYLETTAGPERVRYSLKAKQNGKYVSLVSPFGHYDLDTGEIIFELYETDRGTGDSTVVATDTAQVVMNTGISLLQPDQDDTVLNLAAGEYAILELDVSGNASYIFSGEAQADVYAATFWAYTENDAVRGVRSDDYSYDSRIEPYTIKIPDADYYEDGRSYTACYAVIYAPESTQVTLRYFTKSDIANVGLTQTSELPDFIEGISIDGYYWHAGTISLKLSYENGNSEVFSWDTADSHSLQDRFGNWIELYPYAMNSENVLEEGSSWDMAAGSYYGVIAVNETPFRKPGTDANAALTPENTVCVPFEVVTMEEAASANVLTARPEPYSLNSVGGYYVAGKYTAQQAGTIDLSTDLPLRNMRAYDAASMEQVSGPLKYISPFQYMLTAEAGQTLYVLFRLKELENTSLTVSEAKTVVGYDVYAVGDTTRTEGVDNGIGTGDFGVALNYQDGSAAYLVGREKDAYGNEYAYEMSDGESAYDFVDDDTHYNLRSGSYSTFAFSYASGTYYYDEERSTRSDNDVQIVITPAEPKAYPVLEEGIIEKMDAETDAFSFTPSHSGVFRFTDDQENLIHLTAADEDHRSAASVRGNSLYFFEKDRTYVIKPLSRFAGVRYIKAEELTVPTVSGTGGSLQAEAMDGGQCALFRVDEDGNYTFTADAGTGDADFFMHLTSTAGNFHDAYPTGGKATLQQTLPSDGIYCLYLSGDRTYALTVTKGSTKPVSIALRAERAGEYPYAFGEDYLYSSGCVYLDESFADGTVETIPADYETTGATGVSYRFESDDYYSGRKYDLSVYPRTQGISQTSVRVTLGSGTDLPQLTLGTASQNGRQFGNMYFYRFVAPEDGRYIFMTDATGILEARTVGGYRRGSEIALEQGETAIVRAYDYGAGSPQVTAMAKPSVTKVEITGLPDVLLHQVLAEGSADGTKIRVTYDNNTSGTYTIGQTGYDRYDNEIKCSAGVLPSSNGEAQSVKLTVIVGDRKAEQTTILTDPDTLPVMPVLDSSSSYEAYNSLPSLTLDQVTAGKWYQFTPAEDGWYNMGIRGEISGFNTYMWVYDAASTSMLSSPYRLKGNRQYVIKFGMNKMADVSFDPNTAVYLYHGRAEDEGHLARHTVTYKARMEDGTEVTDARVLALLPAEKAYYEGSVVPVMQPSAELCETDAGTLAFVGMDITDEKVTVNSDIVITSIWSIDTHTHAISFEFQPQDGSPQLPDEVMELLPQTVFLREGASHTFALTAGTEIETQTGTWTFQGFTVNGAAMTSVTMGEDDIDAIGTWKFTEEYYDVSYVFEDEDGNTDLPEEVLAVKPKTTEYLKGTVLAPEAPLASSVQIGDVIWNFIGYDKTSATVGRDGVVFTGTWSFKTVYTVRYVYESKTEGKDLPRQIVADKPADQTAQAGTSVEIKRPTKWAYETENGNWTLDETDYQADGDDGITPGTTIELNRNITVTGKWAYADETHNVRYDFVTDDGSTLPDAIEQLKPSSNNTPVLKGTTVTAERPVEETLAVGDKNWTFMGYDRDSAVVGKEDVVFTGTWTHQDICRLSYVFRPEDETLTLPEAVTSLKPGDVSRIKGSSETIKMPARTDVIDADEAGHWTFTGYVDENGTPFTDSQVTLNSNMTLTGIWKYEFYQVQVSYAFRSATSRKLPDEILAAKPEDQTVDKSSNVTLVLPEQQTWPVAAGTWTFKGYQVEGAAEPVTVLTNVRKDTVATGTWEYAEITYNVSSVFAAATGTLPQDKLEAFEALRPADTTVVQGSTVQAPDDPAVGTLVEDGDACWVFEGYSPETVTDVHEAVTFTGTWTRQNVTHRIRYAFEVSADSERSQLDDDVLALKPADQIWRDGETAAPVMPHTTRVGVGPGSWSFEGYGQSADGEDILFTGTWTFRKENHKLTYVFESADTTEPDQALLNKCPAEKTYARGTQISQAEVPVGDVLTTEAGTWTLKRYDRTFPITIGDKDLTVTGIWRFEAKPAEGEVPAADAVGSLNNGNVQEIADAIAGADNQKIINSFEDGAADEDTAITNLQQFTDQVDDTFEGIAMASVEGSGGNAGGDISVAPTEAGTALVDGETITVYMSGAAATVANVISSLDPEEEQAYTADGDNAFRAVVSITVENSEDTSLKMDISLAVEDKNGDTVESTDPENPNDDELKLAGPVTVTLGIPSKYQNKAFTLMHYPNGRENRGAEISYSWNTLHTAITFVLPSLSPVDIQDVRCQNPEDHVWKADDKQDATCTADGRIHYICENGCVEEYSEVLAATGHTWGTWTVKTAATCTSNETVERECEHCHEKETQERTGTKVPHALEKHEAVAPTCTEAGHHAYYECTNCHNTFSDDQGKNPMTAAQIHDPATGHGLVRTPAKAATTAAAGNIEYWTCSHCGKIFSDAAGKNEITLAQTVIPKLTPTDGGSGSAADQEAARKAEEARKAAEAKAAADAKAAAERAAAEEAARKAAEAAKFTLNVKNGASVPVALKKNNKNIHVVKLGDGDSLAAATSAAPAVVSAKLSGSNVVLKGLKPGKSAKVTVTTQYGGSVTFTVKVQKKGVAVKTKSIKMKTTTLKVGETFDITTGINPVTTPDKMKFTLDKKGKKVISVSKKGIITAKKAGSAKLTIQCGSKKKTVTVKVVG